MPARAVAVLAASLIGSLGAVAVAGPASGEAGGSFSGGKNAVGAWVVGSGPGGGVRPPSSGAVCSGWDHAAKISSDPGVVDLGTVRTGADGTVWNLYFRDCGTDRQFVWVPDLAPADLGRIAFDEVLRKLPKPAPVLSPDASMGGWVNFETWLAVRDPGVVTATASIPGLSATATARVVSIEWAPGDGAQVECAPFGALPPSPGFIGAAPCGHTYRFPSHPKITGTSDLAFHGSVTLVWQASWSSSTGASGDLGEARSTGPFTYQVREIQTIGVEG